MGEKSFLAFCRSEKPEKSFLREFTTSGSAKYLSLTYIKVLASLSIADIVVPAFHIRRPAK